MKLFESMAMRKPIILPRYAPLLKIVVDGKEGLFFNLGNRKELRENLISLITDEEKRLENGN